MPRKLPLHVERNHVKGHTYLSFRIGKGLRIRLPSDPTSDEFKEAYRAAVAGETIAKRERRAPEKPDTIAALIASYLRSGDYTKLRATTKEGYASRIEMLRTVHGHRTVSGLTRERIETGILGPYADRPDRPDRPGAALATLKMLRVLIRHAITIKWLRHDPSQGIARPKIHEIRSWTDAETAAFERRWPIGTKQRTAYTLMLYLGEARADIHRMTWRQIEADSANYVRSKTSVPVDMRIHSELRKALAAAPRGHVTIINTEYGRPFTVAGFSQFMRAAMGAAGLPLDCKPHGLRKTLGRRLADAGCSAHQIMAALGHKTLAEAERYTRDADRRRGGRDAIKMLEEETGNTIAQTTPRRFGESAKTKGKSG